MKTPFVRIALLSLAIVSALALAACGGSGSTTEGGSDQSKSDSGQAGSTEEIAAFCKAKDNTEATIKKMVKNKNITDSDQVLKFNAALSDLGDDILVLSTSEKKISGDQSDAIKAANSQFRSDTIDSSLKMIDAARASDRAELAKLLKQIQTQFDDAYGDIDCG